MTLSTDHVERWRIAQKKEDGFWRRDDVLVAQIERVVSRYGPALEELAASLAPDARILDFGCGPTCPGRYIDRGLVTFLDPLMSSYQETYGQQLPERGKVRAIAERIPVPDGIFDAAVTFNALDHMVDPRAVLEEVARVLKPGGALIVGVFLHSAPIAALRRCVDRYLAFAREDAHPYSCTVGDVESLLSGRYVIESQVSVHHPGNRLTRWAHRDDRVFFCRRR